MDNKTKNKKLIQALKEIRAKELELVKREEEFHAYFNRRNNELYSADKALEAQAKDLKEREAIVHSLNQICVSGATIIDAMAHAFTAATSEFKRRGPNITGDSCNYSTQEKPHGQ